MTRISLVLFVILAAHLGGCAAHKSQLRQNAKQSAIYFGVVASVVAVMMIAGCESCTFQTAPDQQ